MQRWMLRSSWRWPMAWVPALAPALAPAPVLAPGCPLVHRGLRAEDQEGQVLKATLRATCAGTAILQPRWAVVER